MVRNERSEDTHIFHYFFVNINNQDGIALMKYVVLGERDTAIFEQAKKSSFMQNVATNIKLGNGSYETDVTNTQKYRTILSKIVHNVHTLKKRI